MCEIKKKKKKKKKNDVRQENGVLSLKCEKQPVCH